MAPNVSQLPYMVQHWLKSIVCAILLAALVSKALFERVDLSCKAVYDTRPAFFCLRRENQFLKPSWIFDCLTVLRDVRRETGQRCGGGVSFERQLDP